MIERSIEYMTTVNHKIEKIISSPYKKMTKDEAKAMLISCGVMTKKGEIKSAYKKILIQKRASNNAK